MIEPVGCTVAELLADLGLPPVGPPAGSAPLRRLLDAGQLRGEAGHDAVAVMSAAAAAEGPPQAPPALLLVPTGTSWLPGYPGLAVEVADPRLALALASRRFAPAHLPEVGVHPLASVHAAARLGADVRVAPGAVVLAGAALGDRCSVGPGAVVGEGAQLGEDCVLHANVTLYPGVSLGRRVVVHAGSVIGADGFGYAASRTGAVKVHHLGTVVLGDDVEVGANACIDRGTLGATVVGDRTKIDNHCQIGHNVQVGSDSLIAGMTGVAGSVRIGSGVILGGYVAVSDHVTIGDGARIAGRSGVTKDVPAGATWAGFPAKPYRAWVRELYLLGRLEELWGRSRREARKAGERS